MNQAHGCAQIANRILLSLALPTFDRIKRDLEPVSLARGQVIAQIGQPLRHVYFINRGIVSVIKTMQDGRSVEIGAIGIEGMTSAITLVGFDKTILEAVVQIPGSALRMSRDAAIQAMENNKVFNQVVHDHARFALGQIAQTAATCAFRGVDIERIQATTAAQGRLLRARVCFGEAC